MPIGGISVVDGTGGTVVDDATGGIPVDDGTGGILVVDSTPRSGTVTPEMNDPLGFTVSY